MEWLVWLQDLRVLTSLSMVAFGVMYLASSPAKEAPHVRWIAAASIVYGVFLLKQALVGHFLGTPPPFMVLLSSYLAAVAIMCLSVGLDGYLNPAGVRPAKAAIMVGLVPLGLMLVNLAARAAMDNATFAGVLSTAALTCYPAGQAVRIYRTDRWLGHLVLVAALLLVPVALVVSASLGLSLEQYRSLAIYPATLAIITSFGLLELRDAMERHQQMQALKLARTDLRSLADSLESTVRSRTERLEAVIDGLKAFNALVSHDLRAPLRNAAGSVDAAMEELKAGHTAGALAALELVRRESRRGALMVDDLLRLSSVEEAALRLELTDMNEVFSAAVQALKVEYPTAADAISVGELPTVEADAGLMRHVAINLLGNALKYGRYVAGLKVTVGAERLSGDHWRFEVADNGPGFAPAQAARLFEPFVRAPGTREPGTGIGLTVVARVIARHHGAIGATGAPGAGATFWWTLPDRQLEKTWQ